jgi:haloalkane dehalogenase
MTGDRPAAGDVNAVIDAHERSGYRLAVGGVETFVLDLGHGQPVVCLHGVPASSFLYRKLIVELAARGLRGIAFDLPGLGLAERPAAFDYTWTGLGRFASAAVEALDLDRFHLVVHDIGAPVGFELAAAHPGRVASLTVLNAPVEVDTFHRPWVMKPFAVKGLGEADPRLLNQPTFRWLMRHQGIADLSKITTAELDAYLVLLRRTDNGRAFLKIMRGFSS